MKKLCEVCGSKELSSELNLGFHPLCDDLIPIGSNKKNKLYKIEIIFCRICYTAHQKHQVKKKLLFPKNYHYRARFTNDVINGMSQLAKDANKFFHNIKDKVVLDIGCNDGSLLNFFYDQGFKTIGVEPTNAYKDVDKTKHIILNNYFDIHTVKKIKSKFTKIDLITFTNVFAHINDLQKLLKNLKFLLNKQTKIIIENHYLGSVLENNQFDTFYHEHPRTYSLKSFLYIAKILNLNILNVHFPKRYGGNIRVLMGKGERADKMYVKRVLNYEKKFQKKFQKINKKIKSWQYKKKNLLKHLFKKYGKLKTKSFPGRAAILVRLLDINEKLILSVYEKPNSMKVGNYVPGTRIPIKSDNLLFKNIKKEKIILNLAWHISSEIKKYLRKRGFKGKIVDILEKKDFNNN